MVEWISTISTIQQVYLWKKLEYQNTKRKQLDLL